MKAHLAKESLRSFCDRHHPSSNENRCIDFLFPNDDRKRENVVKLQHRLRCSVN